MSLSISTAFAALILLLITLLAMFVTLTRMRTPREPSDEQREALRRAIRTHANNFEHGLPVILMLVLYEAAGAGATALCTIGVLFLVTRLLYSFGYLTRPGGPAQQVGAGATYLIELLLIGALLQTLI